MDLNGDHFSLAREELAGLHRYQTPPYRLTSNYWNADGPSTWLTVSVFTLIRRKYPSLTEKDHLMVAGHVLRTDWKEVVRLIRWNENYLTAREGAEYTVLDGSYE